MVRLMLVLSPAMCVMAAVALSTLLTTFLKDVKHRPRKAGGTPTRLYSSAAVLLGLVFLLGCYVIHCTWVSVTSPTWSGKWNTA